jgi:serine phosphatase RsbU (regulator of sigma subunit)
LLVETFRRPAIVSRWLLVLAETVESAVVLRWENLDRTPLYLLLCLLIYNVASLFVVHRMALKKRPIACFTCLDMIWLTVVSAYTGMAQSPFIGQFFLVIFASSLFFGISGGLLTGVYAAAATSILALWSAPPRIEDTQIHVPYFLISGAFSGYLVDRLNASLIENEQAKATEREIMLAAEATRHELELARIMQEAALPQAPVQCPGMEVASEWEFAREVGGDFHVFLTDNDRIGIVLGDVSGKGVPAALAATTIGHLIPWLRPLDNPERALGNLNLDLVRRLPTDAFATLQFAIIDRSTGALDLWNAGHPPAVLCRVSHEKSLILEHFNPLLGVMPEWDGSPQKVQMRHGDVLVLYSDGLIEARNEEREMFGIDNVDAVVTAHAGESAAEIALALRHTVANWGTVTDDLTIVVCKYTGTRSQGEDCRASEP